MTRRQTQVVIITAVVLGLFCLGMVFWALTRSPDPFAEPVPHPTTSAPTTTSTTTSTTAATTTTTTPPPTTTTTTRPPVKAPVAPPKTTTHPPAAPAPPAATTGNGLCQADQWQRDTPYNGGALVRHNDAEWLARSWNYNAEPGANADNAWIRVLRC